MWSPHFLLSFLKNLKNSTNFKIFFMSPYMAKVSRWWWKWAIFMNLYVKISTLEAQLYQDLRANLHVMLSHQLHRKYNVMLESSMSLEEYLMDQYELWIICIGSWDLNCIGSCIGSCGRSGRSWIRSGD